MPFNITDLARKYAPWSYSRMSTAETCPAQFAHKSIWRTPSAAAPSDTKVGIAAHEILEHRVTGSNNKEARDRAFVKTPLTTSELELLATMSENMEVFLRKFEKFCHAQKVQKVFTEVEWGFTDGYKAAGFFAKDVYFRGKLDLGALTPNGDLFLIDHKSGIAKDLKTDTNKKQQLQAYAVLALPNLPDLAGVRSAINFLQGDEDKLLQWTDYIPSDRITKLYAAWLFGRINDAASNLVEPFESRPAKKMPKGWPCAWCGYQSSCEAFKEKFGQS